MLTKIKAIRELCITPWNIFMYNLTWPNQRHWEVASLAPFSPPHRWRKWGSQLRSDRGRARNQVCLFLVLDSTLHDSASGSLSHLPSHNRGSPHSVLRLSQMPIFICLIHNKRALNSYPEPIRYPSLPTDICSSPLLRTFHQKEAKSKPWSHKGSVHLLSCTTHMYQSVLPEQRIHHLRGCSTRGKQYWTALSFEEGQGVSNQAKWTDRNRFTISFEDVK